jgi:dephospho-CoA kinase
MFNLTTSLIILITGASGSGKTTVLKELQKSLPYEQISIFHFDDIGVPSLETMIQEYGSPENWQQAMTELWITKLSKIKETKLIFLEGSFNPEFAINTLRKLSIKDYKLFCIHSDRAIREQRLQHQRNQPELITNNMEKFAQLLKQKTIEHEGIIVNNNNSTGEVVQDIIKNIQIS